MVLLWVYWVVVRIVRLASTSMRKPIEVTPLLGSRSGELPPTSRCHYDRRPFDTGTLLVSPAQYLDGRGGRQHQRWCHWEEHYQGLPRYGYFLSHSLPVADMWGWTIVQHLLCQDPAFSLWVHRATLLLFLVLFPTVFLAPYLPLTG